MILAGEKKPARVSTCSLLYQGLGSDMIYVTGHKKRMADVTRFYDRSGSYDNHISGPPHGTSHFKNSVDKTEST